MPRTRRSFLCLPLLLCLGLGSLATGLVSCSSDKPIPIAVVLPLTGEFALYGEPIRRGIELAYEEVQAAQELELQLDLGIVDSQGDPARAAQLLETAFEEGAPGAIGGVITDEALAMVKVADEWDRTLISPSASSPRLTGVSSNFVRVYPSDFLEGTKMGNAAAETLSLERIVVVAAESQYPRGIQQVFRSAFENSGGEVLEVIEYPPNTSDLSGVIDRVMTLAPDGVYLADYADGLVNLIQSLDEAGYDGELLTTSSFAAPEAIAQVGDQAEGVFFTQSLFDLESEEPHVQQFVDAYREKYGSDPDLYAAHGYDAMKVMAQAFKEGGGRLPQDLWRGIRAINSFPGVTGTIQFDEKGDVQKFPRVYVVQDGAPVDYETILEERRREFEQRRQDIERRLRALQRGGTGS